MRVLILIHEYPPIGGGAAVACAHMARTLVELGHEATVVTTGWGERRASETKAGVRILRVPGRRESALENKVLATAASFASRGYRLAAREIEARRPDVVHAFFTLPAGAVALRLGKRFRLPVLVSLRGSDVPGYNPVRFKATTRLSKPVIRWVWREADCVVAVSDGLRRLALETLPGGEIHVVHNAADTERFRPAAEGREDGGPLRMVTVTRLVKWKGIQHVLEALAGLGACDSFPYTFKIIGEGGYGPRLRALAEGSELHTVQFLGGLAHNELLPHLQAADLFVCPSLTEGFPNAFAEAMACGLPVLATHVGGIPELVRDGIDGVLVPPGNVDAIRAALRTAASDRERLKQMGKTARDRMVAEFGWRAKTLEYVSHYHRIATPRT